MLEFNENPSETPLTPEISSQFELVIQESPEHPFSRIANQIIDKGKDVYANTVHWGLHAGVVGKSFITIGAEFDAINPKTYTSIMEAVEPLQHVTNMGASYAVVGASIATSEFLTGALEEADQSKLAQITQKVVPTLGVIAATGIQLFVESHKIMPWDTLDDLDALYGIAIIIPGYFAARHYVSNKLKIKELGTAFSGRIRKKVETASDVILPSDIEVKEVIQVRKKEDALK